MKNSIMKINIINVGKNSTPKYMHEGDAGFDLQADFSHLNNIIADKGDWDEKNKYFILFSGGRAAIPTGIKFEIPKGYEMQIRGRSGLAIKNGIIAHVGTLDSGYRGEACVILYNFSSEPFYIKQGDRIGQAIINKINKVEFIESNELNKSDRGANGSGSSGI